MVKKAINKTTADYFTNSAIELVKWPDTISKKISDQVVAFQTTRLSPFALANLNDSNILAPDVPYGDFNLGQHVGDCVQQVNENRQKLIQLIQRIQQPVSNNSLSSVHANSNEVKIQWLEQVHGNQVVIVNSVNETPLVADASITRDRNIALAIMTADCLPILLTSKNGEEVAAIHGGWRSLSANIIANTIEKMQSNASEIVAWLGPCIGPNSFEVGGEVKQAFVQLGDEFEKAFIKKVNGKYLANLHSIAHSQLLTCGIHDVSNLNECTYQQPNKYYSYRKNTTTGRMVSIICRR